MLYIVAVFATILMLASIFLIFLGLPGTWSILIITALWSFFTGAANMGYNLFVFLLVLAIVGEIIEFFASHLGTKKFGGSGKGSLGGMLGGLVGAILFAPLFFGLGALLGALLGAFAGCFIVEKFRGAELKAAIKAAIGTTLGRFSGFLVKLGIAVCMLFYSIPALWQSIR